ncbi:hypothetical protein EPUS_01237 [Endocarpon pusillum Z07020]|uniref:Extracellular membrane protein CFEM domain-containing protein n=1 Tax=Endocarpon pusillum (strain Z07020 / HMAS-L-300199) TaxID=1263415 RepID=U1GUZ7_ENDPU|nr:uncharacterized protein EPUS_01237 [Endocarpon pusillum Z07020]ERF75871.1 hypothetical protein EPUS_01237 [Endocarpon pusillum Z07020]
MAIMNRRAAPLVMALFSLAPSTLKPVSAAVDPSLIPDDCSMASFFTSCSSTPLPCPRLDTPCAQHVNGCYQYEEECFCALPQPIACAWACPWAGWMRVEDWYRNTCGSLKTIDFALAPGCARDCIREGSFNYGCVTEEQSCFCQHASVFDCEQQCTQRGKDRLQEWVRDQCKYTEGEEVWVVQSGSPTREEAMTTATATPTQTGREESNASKGDAIIINSTADPLSWYEILAVTVASVSGAALVVAWFLIWRHKRMDRRNMQRRQKEEGE